MTPEQIHNDAAILANLAGLPIPEDRLAALSNGLALARAQLRPVLTRDYGLTEPASRFRPPPSR